MRTIFRVSRNGWWRGTEGACGPIRAARITSCRVRVLFFARRVLLTMGNDRLAKTDSGAAKLLQLLLRKFRVSFLHEVECLIHPDDLFFCICLDYAALLNGTEKLITGSVEGGLRASFGPAANPSLTGQSLLRVEVFGWWAKAHLAMKSNGNRAS